MSGIDLSMLNDAQRLIATTLDEPLFVEAGAGSGKTFTLTRRVAWALSPGSGVDGRPFLDGLHQVLVITFTNAAAREIKERVRSTLHAAGMREEALAVDSAWISTIHGMCRRILQRNALELNLDPAFDICPTHRAEELFEQAVEQVVGKARRDALPGTPLAQAFDELGYAGVSSRVGALVGVAHAAVGGFEGLVLPGGETDSGIEPSMASLAQAFEALAAQKLTAAAAGKVGPSLEALRAFGSLAPGQRDARHAADALACCSLPRSSKAIADWHAAAKEELAHTKLLVQLELMRDLAPDLVDLARATDERYGELKQSLSLLDNDDLVSLALRAIEEVSEVRERYVGRFRLVMVDEFQDTDERQLRLISLLAGAAMRGEEPRHLATVGDAQQSIYRFRGADVSVFNARGERVSQKGHVVLNTNYRSHADVLALVDKVCGGERGVLNDFMHLDASPTRDDAYRATSLPRIAVELASGPAFSGYPSKQQVAVLASQVADRLASYRDAGEPAGGMALLLGSTTNADLYIDALRARGLECVVTGGSTFTRAPEVAVMLSLLRTLANPRDTQSGLFPLLSSEMFELDANDFLQLGSRRQDVLDAPTKRSIERGLATLELFGDAEPSLRLRYAHEVLSRALREVSRRPVADVCMDVLRDSGWLSRLEGQGAQGRAREANVLAAVRYIRELTGELGLGPVRAAVEFARWLEASKVPPASLAGSQRDTVRIMTIHASKGLEYPVVAVAECWNNPRSEAGVLAGRGDSGETRVVLAPAGLKAGDVSSEGTPADLAEWYVELKRRNAQAEAQEKARLLYVALTRAREALVLAVSAPLGKDGVCSELADGTIAALFGGSLPSVGATHVDFGGSAAADVRHVALTRDKGEPFYADSAGSLAALDGELPADAMDIVRMGTPEQDASDEGARRVVQLYPTEVVACDEVCMTPAREGVYSYSSAFAGRAVGQAGGVDTSAHKGRQSLPTREQREAAEAGEASTADADKATNLGSAFHALAQTMVESGREPTPTRVDALCTRWNLSERQRTRLRAALDTWCASELRREALGYGLVRAEVPFFAVAESAYGSYVEGAIDLLCTEGPACEGHALVVDYKTGDIGLSPEQVRARHEAQANLYAQVLLSQGFSSVTCAFICVETGIVVRYEHRRGNGVASCKPRTNE